MHRLIRHQLKSKNDSKCSGVLFEDDERHFLPADEVEYTKSQYPVTLVWLNVYLTVLLHLIAIYAVYRWTQQENAFLKYACFYCFASFFRLGVTAGYHRLWTHKSYKAKLPFRILLALMGAGCGQGSIYIWSRDHRTHHKFSETHADPHNAKRGFFFAHMGWLLCKRHPDVIEKGKTIDLSDLEADPVVIWQYNNFEWILLLTCFVLPTLFAKCLLSLSLYDAAVVAIGIYVQGLHQTWLVNSAAHLWGEKPYDKKINPSENIIVSILGLGEGWHNYHHTFPWDYKTSELGFYKYNITTAFIDFFAWIGWAYDLKTVSSDVVRQRVLRTGDKSEWENSNSY